MWGQCRPGRTSEVSWAHLAPRAPATGPHPWRMQQTCSRVLLPFLGATRELLNSCATRPPFEFYLNLLITASACKFPDCSPPWSPFCPFYEGKRFAGACYLSLKHSGNKTVAGLAQYRTGSRGMCRLKQRLRSHSLSSLLCLWLGCALGCPSKSLPVHSADSDDSKQSIVPQARLTHPPRFKAVTSNLGMQDLPSATQAHLGQNPCPTGCDQVFSLSCLAALPGPQCPKLPCGSVP